ncbi:helix-turn-helix family protein [Asticcacaulis biprosthecium C19]|uniref:Helix-turn-helix family protein n=1 Tax=Asticcacaulis biprosthecium C19 TaxID=715226 RepID=F4QJD8_9CAUL|nr:mobile mystery protein A [Asticcacaulis biprosthecium]EGF93121.1 helix-turn-helix family protein [Asticcacaulis biprosthecium C19]
MFDGNNREALARKHLDRIFQTARLDGLRQRPPKGWVRAIRDALGLTNKQLSARLGKAHSTLVRLESSEMADTISLSTLRAAAEAMDCTLVYALVPNKPLEQTVRERAGALADQQLARVHHTMGLEDQAVRGEDLTDERERLISAILARGGRHLWEDQ